MKKLILTILILSIFYPSCSIVFPIVATIKDNESGYNEIIDINYILKFDYVKITTCDSSEFFGEVIEMKIFEQIPDSFYNNYEIRIRDEYHTRKFPSKDILSIERPIPNPKIPKAFLTGFLIDGSIMTAWVIWVIFFSGALGVGY